MMKKIWCDVNIIYEEPLTNPARLMTFGPNQLAAISGGSSPRHAERYSLAA